MEDCLDERAGEVNSEEPLLIADIESHPAILICGVRGSIVTYMVESVMRICLDPWISLLLDDSALALQGSGLSSHIIICGAAESFVSFVQQLRKCDPISTPIVVLHPELPKAIWPQLKAQGPMHFVQASRASSAHRTCHCSFLIRVPATQYTTRYF